MAGFPARGVPAEDSPAWGGLNDEEYNLAGADDQGGGRGGRLPPPPFGRLSAALRMLASGGSSARWVVLVLDTAGPLEVRFGRASALWAGLAGRRLFWLHGGGAAVLHRQEWLALAGFADKHRYRPSRLADLLADYARSLKLPLLPPPPTDVAPAPLSWPPPPPLGCPVATSRGCPAAAEMRVMVRRAADCQPAPLRYCTTSGRAMAWTAG